MATVTKGYEFSASELVTNTKLTTLVDSATVTAIANADIDAGAAIANTKLAAPKSYFTVCITKTGQFSATVDPVAKFQMPFAATLVEVSACARAADNGDADETYTVDIEEGGTSVLAAAIAISRDAPGTPVVGSISDAAIADNAAIEVVLTLDGTSPTLDDLTVLLTFKVAHVA